MNSPLQNLATATNAHAPDAPAGRSGPMSVGRVLAILDLLSQNPQGLALSEMSRRLFCPKVSLLALLNELVTLGYIRRNLQAHFELDTRARRLGLQLSSSGALHRTVRDTLTDLCERLCLNAAFGYLDRRNRTLIYADRCEADTPVRFTVKLGEQLHIHSRSLGKLLLAYEPEADWSQWLGAEPYPQIARNTRTTLAEITPDLREIRRKGMAWAVAEQWSGAAGCACPIRDAEEQVAAGLVVSGPVDALNGNKVQIARELAAAAASLSSEFKLRAVTAHTLHMFI